MKIPLSWISLYSPLTTLLEKYPIKNLAHEYSIHTAEIDTIEQHDIDKVVVGKVLSCEKHPESKKLSIVRVGLGDLGEETILTGAPNITEAHYVPVALVGATLPGDFVIGERVMAGMMSRGMICGADEIGMSTESSGGIMILEEDWDQALLEKMLGKSFFDLTLPFPGKNGEIYHYPLRDTTFEIDNKFITNRPDLFSVIGNAREFHAVFDVGFDNPEPKNLSQTNIRNIEIKTDRVSAFHALEMSNISVGKSPYGISLMMERAGLGPKMDIVDITNLIMTEVGQPMHVFDADKITGNISVRMAKNGETLIALNGTEYTLTSEDIVIADERGVLSIAGVMGGMESAVSETTTHIIWESGCFDPQSIRLTAQRHGLRTDASTRYEKSLDPLLAGTTFGRVLQYMKFLGKNTDTLSISAYTDTTKVQNITIEVDYTFIEKKIGTHIPKEQIIAILGRLGFSVRDLGDSVSVGVPSWRATKDISIREDIVEEISRVIGYESVPTMALPMGLRIIEKNDDTNLRDITLDHFRDEKWHEIYTYSFTSASLDEKVFLTHTEDAIAIRNAFNEEYTHMRRSLAPRLLLSAGENMKHADIFGFFEIGKIYTKSISHANTSLLENIKHLPFPERKMIAGVLVAKNIETLRATLESYLKKTLGYIPPVHSGTILPLLHPGMSGSYREGDISLVEFGTIHPEVALSFDLPSSTLYFEIDYEEILSRYSKKDLRFQPISRYQTIERELNFLMPKHTPTSEVASIIDMSHPWIGNIIVSSIYEDESKIGAGKKSVSFSFVLSNHESTISDDEAMHVQNTIIEKMKTHGYALRTA